MCKKIIISLIYIVFSIQSFSQCVPDTIYQDSLPNIWPSSGFPDATVGLNYSQIWTMKIPSTLIEAALGDTAFVTVDTLGQTFYIGDWPVDSVVTIDVLNTPPGMSVDCNTSNCVFPGGTVACAEINGTPTISDWYDLQIISNLYSHGVITVIVGGVPLTLPVNVNYFDIVGHYDTVSRYMITVNQASSLENINNNLEIRKIGLKNNNLQIEIQSNFSERFHMSITDVIGKKVLVKEIKLESGKNNFIFNRKLQEGLYLINLQNQNARVSDKFYLDSK
tara:strand:- start:135 stop:968 length:834 start_codon:yes stop_codon:yes gene_type:complete